MFCIHCKFECNDLKIHSKSEWHLYNLRREAVGLLPVSLTDFQTKQNDLIKKNLVEIPDDLYCCGKVYKSNNTYQNHLKSKKHIEKSKSVVSKDIKGENIEVNSDDDIFYDDDDDDESEEYDTASESEAERVIEPLTPLHCLFCESKSKTIENNVNHMKERHKFKLPYPDCISNLEGLIEYLVCLIDEYHVCLQCNKQFDDRLAVRNHMLHMNHNQLYFHLESNGDDLCDYYENLPIPTLNLSELSDGLDVEAQLPGGKRLGHRKMRVYFNQNLNGLSSNESNPRAICDGVEKAKMSLVQCSRQSGALVSCVATPQDKKYRTLEARYVQLRSSRFSNFQQHFRAQIL